MIKRLIYVQKTDFVDYKTNESKPQIKVYLADLEGNHGVLKGFTYNKAIVDELLIGRCYEVDMDTWSSEGRNGIYVTNMKLVMGEDIK